jgi:hypothetical protein
LIFTVGLLRDRRRIKQRYPAPDAVSSPKIYDFLQKHRLKSSPVVRLSDPASDGGVRPFGILADGRPIRSGDRAFDVLTLNGNRPAPRS